MKSIKPVSFIVIFVFAVWSAFIVGCSTTPKVVSRSPATTGYQYGAEPSKTVTAPESREYKRHVRESQAMALAHERNLAAMEYQNKEATVAQELGIQTPAPVPTPTASAEPQRNWGNGGAPIPWRQASGNMPTYQPAPLPPPPMQVTAPYGYGNVAYVGKSWGPFNFGASIIAVPPPPVYYSPYYYPQRTVVYHHHTSFGGVLGFGGRHHGHGRHR